jgi:phage terminase large subunit-like protein
MAKKKPAAYPQAARVDAYARDVLAGRIVAGWLVRSACQRHLDDLEHGAQRGLVWIAARADGALNFFEKTLHLSDGVPFKLEPFQAFIVGSLYGWWMVDREKSTVPLAAHTPLLARVTAGTATAADRKALPELNRRFRFFYGEIGKGNGKTPLAAGLGLMHLEFAFDPAPEVYSAAAAKPQARICFEDAAGMVQASPRLRDHIEVLTGAITIAKKRARFLPLSSEDRGQHGKRVSFAALDEVHAHESARMARAMIAGTKNQKNALIALITNSGHDHRTICWQYHETAVRILEGRIRRDNFFAYVCTLDPCPQCAAARHQQPDLKCKRCDQYDDPAKWIKANPGLGTICRRSYIEERIETARTQSSELNDVLQLNLCMWVKTAAGWANLQQWNSACHDPKQTLEQFRGCRAALAMDAANRVDITSLVAVIEREPESGPLDPEKLTPAARAALEQSVARQVAEAEQADPVLDAEETPPEPTARTLSAGGYAVFAWHFVPENMVDHAGNANAEAYRKWQQAGQLNVTPGAVTDFAAIMRKIREIAGILQVVRFQCDPRELGYFMQRLTAQDWCTFEVAEVSQSSAMISQPMKELEALIASGLIKHDGNEPLAWMLGNVVQKTTSSGGPLKYYYPTKPNDAAKIDAAVSMIMGVDGILRGAEPVGDPGVIMLG